MVEQIPFDIAEILDSIKEAPRKKIETVCFSLHAIYFGSWELTHTRELTKRNAVYAALIDYCIFIEDVKRRKEEVSEVIGESEGDDREQKENRKRNVDDS